MKGEDMVYSISEIYDDIGFNESFSGNEGCLSGEELRDVWISRLFNMLLKEQGNEESVDIDDSLM